MHGTDDLMRCDAGVGAAVFGGAFARQGCATNNGSSENDESKVAEQLSTLAELRRRTKHMISTHLQHVTRYRQSHGHHMRNFYS